MRNTLWGLVVLLLASSAALGAESWERRTKPDVLIQQGAVRLGGGEVRALIVGKTETWGASNSGRDAGYYAPDGRLLVKYNGARDVGRYTIKPNGSVCLSLTKLPEGGCHYYLRYRNKVVVVWQGLTRGVKRYQPGNRL